MSVCVCVRGLIQYRVYNSSDDVREKVTREDLLQYAHARASRARRRAEKHGCVGERGGTDGWNNVCVANLEQAVSRRI